MSVMTSVEENNEKCYNAFYDKKKEEGLQLLNQLDDPSAVTVDGFTLLHVVAYQGWVDVFEKLVTEYNCDVNSKSAKNKTPVFIASREGNFEVVKYLSIKCQCDLTIKSKKGRNNALDVARRNNKTDVVNLLESITTIRVKCMSRADVSVKIAGTHVHLSTVSNLSDEYKNGQITVDTSCQIARYDGETYITISNQVSNESIQDVSSEELTDAMSSDPVRPNEPVSSDQTDDRILTGSDLLAVLEATIMVTDWWYFLGVTLGLRPDVLERIECDGRNMQRNMTLKWCQCKMILKWLDTGLASWSSLVKALKSPIINKNEVAEQIIKDHPKKCLKRKGEQRQLEEEEGTEENQSKRRKSF